MADRFPKEMARGLKHEEWVNDEPPYKSAFFFDKRVRKDGRRELSVVDLGYDGALSHLKSQKIGDDPLFPAGFAVLKGEKIEAMIKKHKYPLDYEHKPSQDNQAHGNILIGRTASYVEKKIASRLAMSAMIFPIDKDYPRSHCLSFPYGKRCLMFTRVRPRLTPRVAHACLF